MANPKELIELITLVAQGDRRAGDRLFRNYLLGTIEGQVRRLQGGAPVQEREDMAQQMALWLAEALERDCQGYDPLAGGPDAYLRTIVKRCAYRWLRDGKAIKRNFIDPGQEGDEAEGLISLRGNGLNDAQAKELQGEIEAFLQTQSDEKRMVFELSVLEGLPSKDIATLLRMSVAAVQQASSRLKRALLAHLKERGFILVIATFLTFWLALFAPSFSHAEALSMSHTSPTFKGAP